MAPNPPVNAGTITVNKGSTAVTGSGTAFEQLIANVSEIVHGNSTDQSSPCMWIAAIVSDTALTLGAPWPGPSLTNSSDWWGRLFGSTNAAVTEALQILLSNQAAQKALATEARTELLSILLGTTAIGQFKADANKLLGEISDDGAAFTRWLEVLRDTQAVETDHNLPAASVRFDKVPFIKSAGNLSLYVAPDVGSKVLDTDYVGFDGIKAAVERASTISCLTGLTATVFLRDGDYSGDTLELRAHSPGAVLLTALSLPSSLPEETDWVDVEATDLALFNSTFAVTITTTGDGLICTNTATMRIRGIGFKNAAKTSNGLYAVNGSKILADRCGTYGYSQGCHALAGSEIVLTQGFTGIYPNASGLLSNRNSKITAAGATNYPIGLYKTGGHACNVANNSKVHILGSAAVRAYIAKAGSAGCIVAHASDVNLHYTDFKDTNWRAIYGSHNSRIRGEFPRFINTTEFPLVLADSCRASLNGPEYVSGGTLISASHYSYVRLTGVVGAFTYSPAANTEGNTGSYIRV